MWINRLERGRAAVRAADFVATLNILVYVIVDVLLTETRAALIALSRLDHDICAQNTVEEGVVLGWSRLTVRSGHSTLDLLGA